MTAGLFIFNKSWFMHPKYLAISIAQLREKDVVYVFDGSTILLNSPGNKG
jgi:hypothetical protein